MDVLAPVERPVPDFISGLRVLFDSYNGSVAQLSLSPKAIFRNEGVAGAQRFDGSYPRAAYALDFAIALANAKSPIVATFHIRW